MRRMSMVLAMVVAAGGLGLSAVSAQAASSSPAGGPPFPYQDCLKATKQKGESPSYSRWHCDQLVKKGWVTPPTR